MTKMYQQITHVAIKYDGKTYSLPAPNRHHNVIEMIAVENGVGIRGADIQGFLDSNGSFINRANGYKLAVANNQLKRDPDPKFYQGTDLYSEDLW